MGGNLNNQDKQKKAGPLVGAALASALAAASPAHAQENTTDYVGDSYTMDYGSSYEFSGSEDAAKCIDDLSHTFNKQIDDTSTQARFKILEAVDSFIAAHPYVEGKTEITKDGASSTGSYDPTFDLKMALEAKLSGMNPLLVGILFQKLKAEETNRMRMMEGGSK